jgi:Cu+-exporting ATPase
VHELLAENGLQQFYTLNRHPGNRVRERPSADRFAYLNEPAVQQKLLDYADDKLSRVTLHIPSIHCVACVWLLENLFRLHAGVGKSQVNFPKREVAVSFDPRKTSLGELAALLASIGYEPKFTLGTLEKTSVSGSRARQWLQLGIAGFAFGNIMLFALPVYIGLDSFSGPMFARVFGYLSLVIALPVVVYSAADYWKSSWLSLRRRKLTLDVPIAAGLLALYLRSGWEILSGTGEGYLDSLAGLVFLLLCGRAFQQITHERLAFDRDYKCFFRSQ